MYFNSLTKTLTTVRHFFGIVALLCVFLLLGSYFIEHVLLVEPCILCTIQRVLFFLILGTCLIGLFINIFFFCKTKHCLTLTSTSILNWLCMSSTLLYSTIGMLIAGRQSWLQTFSRFSISSCGASLHELIKQYSLITVLKMAIQGKLECSTIGMKILGLSLANWGFINFLIILFFGILVIYNQLTKN